MASYESEIRQFITDKFLFGDNRQLDNNESLLEAGIVDSTGILEIVAHLEAYYGIKVDNDELIPENLDTIASIGIFLEKKIR
jgi:acyl carrier protein